jgi:XTP/dITP diphosphohydrolase
MHVTVATNNPHKVSEIEATLAPLGIEVRPAGDFDSPEETGDTFEENSLIKAHALHDLLAAQGRRDAHGAAGAAGPGGTAAPEAILVIADDSGLCVDALGGAPGVYSSRYGQMGAQASSENDAAVGPSGAQELDAAARPDSPSGDGAGIARLLREMEGVPEGKRTARFVCVITLIDGDETSVFRGECEGRIIEAPRGEGGFGYDPVFVPAGDTRTFAEMPAADKLKISHRTAALAKLHAALAARSGG